MKVKTIIIFSSLFFFIACKNPQTKRLEEISKISESVVQPRDVPSSFENNPYLIKDDSFYGISAGQKIASIEEGKVEKSNIETGEGTFLMYYIISDSGQKIAYFYPDPVDKTLVGNLFVTSPKAFTIDLINIGKTFGEVKKQVNNYEVHGSEMESKTNVFIENIRLELDYHSTNYNLDKNEIPDNAKVKLIWISK